MRPITNPLHPDEIRLLQEAQQVQQLRESVAFRKLYNALQMTVAQALNDLEVNSNPHADAYYKLIWQSRKHVVDAMDTFIDATIAKRRDAVQEFLRSFNVNEDIIQKNLDHSLDFLTPSMNPSIGGPDNGIK